MMKKNKINIIYIGNFDFDSDNAALSRAINNLNIINNSATSKYIFGFSENKCRYTKDDINFNSRPKPTKLIQMIKYFFDMSELKKVVKNNETNVIIMYNLPSLLSLVILFVFKKKCLIISDITEWYSIIGRKKIIAPMLLADINFRMKIINRKVDGLIVISKYLSEYYSSIPHVLIPPITNMRSHENMANISNDSDDTITYIYAGDPGYDKDRLDIILKSFSLIEEKNLHLRNYQFHIYGIDREQYLKRFPNGIHYLKDHSINVKFHGKVTREIVQSNLFNSDYGFLIRENSRRNRAGFPTKFSEMSSIGIPIIYTCFSDLSYYTNNERDILVESLNVKSVTTAILKSMEKKPKKIPSKVLTIHNEDHKTKMNDFISNLINNKQNLR